MASQDADLEADKTGNPLAASKATGGRRFARVATFFELQHYLAMRSKLSARGEGDDDWAAKDDTRAKKRTAFVESFKFNACMGVLIVLNSLTMGIEVNEMDPKAPKKDGMSMWGLVEIFFSVAFLLELSCRLHYHRCSYFLLPSNIFDFFLVVVSCLNTWILEPLLKNSGDLRVLTVLRVIRIVRLIRIIRLVSMFKELWLAIIVLGRSLRMLCLISILIVMVVYIAATFVTVTIGRNDDVFNPYFRKSGGWDHEEYFSTILRSMLTLFQVLTLDNWSEGIARHVMVEMPLMAFFFVVFVAIVSFGLLNFVVGIIVEMTLVCGNENKVKLERSKAQKERMAMRHLKDVFISMDKDSSGTLTVEEVQDAMKQPEVYDKLRMIDFPVDNPEQVFHLLDIDRSGELSIDEFLNGSLKMKGRGRSKDIFAVRMAIVHLQDSFAEFEEEVDITKQKVRKLEDTIHQVLQQSEHVFLGKMGRRSLLHAQHPSICQVRGDDKGGPKTRFDDDGESDDWNGQDEESSSSSGETEYTEDETEGDEDN